MANSAKPAFPELTREQLEDLLLAQNGRVAALETALALALPYVEHADISAPTTPTRTQRKQQAERDASSIRTTARGTADQAVG